MARFTYEELDKNIKNNTINNNFKNFKKNKFLFKKKSNDKNNREKNIANKLNLNKKNEIKYKINSYIEKQKSSFNILSNKNNLIDGKNNTIGGKNCKNDENVNKYYNLIYENKISKLESEIYDLKIKKQTLK